MLAWTMKHSTLSSSLLIRHLFLRANIASIRNSSTSAQFRIKPTRAKNESKPKIAKFESYIHRSFFGEFDPNILSFPSLESRKLETKYYNHIRNNFSKTVLNHPRWRDEGYYDAHEFSNLELCHFFEAIGTSFYRSEALLNFGSPDREYKNAYLRSIIHLLTHNALVQPILEQSSNQDVKNLTKENRKLAFCFSESNEKFASLPYPFWNSIATQEEENWRISGNKSQLLKEDYDHFVVFCKAKLPESNEFGITSFLLDRSEVKIVEDGHDNLGNEYIDIWFDNLVRSAKQHQVYEDLDPQGPNVTLNVIGKGQLMTSAIILGLLKENMLEAIKSPSNKKSSELVCERLVHASRLIYVLESMVYLNAHQFDVFDTNTFDLYLESMSVKIQALNCFYEISKLLSLHLQSQSATRAVDIVNLLDSFLGSSSSNHLLLSSYAVRHYGSWFFDHVAKIRLARIYTNHYMKSLIPYNRRKQSQRYPNAWKEIQNVAKCLDAKLSKSINCLKQSLEIVYDMEEHILFNYGKDCLNNQIDMSRLASIVMSAHQMAAVISRANYTLTTGGRFGHEQLLLCEKTCTQQLAQVLANQSLIEGILEISEEKRSRIIHKRNIKYEGYFPLPVFDRII